MEQLNQDNETKLIGVLVIDLHSISQEDSIEKLKKEQNVQNYIWKSIWDLQENYNNQLIAGEGFHTQSPQNLQKLQQQIEESHICEDNVQNYKFISLEIPQDSANISPLIITFEMIIYWNLQISGKFLFVNSKKTADRNFVGDILKDQGEFTLTANFIAYNEEKENKFKECQKKYFQKEEIGLWQSSKAQYDVEIPEEYFKNCYQEIMYIGGGSFGKVDLYFDRVKKKLVAVKQLLDFLKDPIDIKEHKAEHDRVIQAIKQHPKKSDDTQLQFLNRNIVREIKVLKQLKMDNDPRNKLINRLEGVVLPLIQVNETKSYQTILLVFEHFGGIETQNQSLTCDVYRYFSNYNNRNRIIKSNPTRVDQRIFIKKMFYEIAKAVGYLHEKGVMIRDLKDDNILIRRVYNSEILNQSNYEIQLIDFGLAKKHNTINDYGSSTSSQFEGGNLDLQKQTSIVYLADQVPSRHPIYRYTKPHTIEYDYKDDVYALSVLLLRLHNYFNLLNDIDYHTRKLIEKLSGFTYDQVRDYVIDMIAKRPNDAAECLQDEVEFDAEHLGNLERARDNISLISDISSDVIKDWLGNHFDELEETQEDQNQEKQEKANQNSQFWVYSLGIVTLTSLFVYFKFIKKQK